jgi:Zn-dependent peptidase ImmA (M78 family)
MQVNTELHIECSWLGREYGSAEDRAFYAEIGVAVGDEWLTQLEDITARTVRKHMRGSGYQLAQWFAANWWRLRWEPAFESSNTDVDWRIAHSMAAAGGGYVWPDVLFTSDGASVEVAASPQGAVSGCEPVRYFSGIIERIPATEFERKVDSFIEGVLSRMHSFKMEGMNLDTLWSEVLEERADPGATQWRKLEAMCGYDPDQAPSSMIEMLLRHEKTLGVSSLEEVAAYGRHMTPEILDQILILSADTSSNHVGGFRGTMPVLHNEAKLDTSARPWQQAAELAKFARSEWGLDNHPVTDDVLAEILRMETHVFSDRTKAPVPLPMALRSEDSDNFNMYFTSSWPSSRRFACCRLLGDHLSHSNIGRLIPATTVRTARQQFQRAFAQEFLCPFNGLMERFQLTQPNDDDINEAAKHYGVSPLLVHTTLINKGELDRETLCSLG